MGTNTTARLATETDLAGMAESLSLAFHDDPIMQWLFGSEAPRPMRFSEPFFASEGKRHLGHGHVYTLDGTPGAAYWDPPGQWKTRMRDVVHLAPLMIRGMRLRTINAVRGLGRIEKAHAAHPEHYYLAVLGTRPDRQGEGLGSALMAPVLARCDQDGIGAYLESSKESNIPYYRRHGFEVVGEVDFPSGPRLWPMWRDPRPPE
ncbi:MAG: GNAT family N-acetyltransferase [Acidimicrobiales bacterium]